MINGRDQRAIIARITAEMAAAQVDAMIFTSADAVFYSTGYMSRGLYKAGRTGNSISVVTKTGEVYFIGSEFEKLSAEEAVDPSVHVEAYQIYLYIEDYAYEGMVKEEQPGSLKGYKMLPGILPPDKNMRIGIQKNWITYEAMCYLQELYGAENISDQSMVLNRARMIKTPWEIDILRYTAQKTEEVMNRIGKEVIPGLPHAEIFRRFRQYSLEVAPEMYNVSQAHTLGPFFCPPYLAPDMRLQYGDTIRLDGGLYVNGYKADLGRTYGVGKCSADKERMYDLLYKAREWEVSHIGPGVKLSEVFKGTMDIIKKGIGIPNFTRGHYGHSISNDPSQEEYPYISGKSTEVFQPGMVMCVEAPFYSSRLQTYNVEDTLLVTENGVEMFTQASPSLYI